jgi:predicted PurR-regulated permease PerM
MISKLFDIVLNFITKTIGTTLTVVIVVFLLGIYVAVSYPISSFIVTPDTLQKTEDKFNTKIDKSNAKVNIEMIEMQLNSLQSEKSTLQDKIDENPKQRYIQRLKEVDKYIDTLEKSKKESLNILETK